MSGSFLLSFMAFPLNVIFASVWIILLVWLYKQKRDGRFVRFMLSSKATIIAIALLLIGALGVTFIANFSVSLPFILILLFVQSVLLLVTLRGCRRNGKIRWRFLLNHAGLWLALFAGFWGAADSHTLRVPVLKNSSTQEAYYDNGTVTHLDYTLQLKDFSVEYYPNGAPAHYEAHIIIDSDTVAITVNNPYEYSCGEDIYLTNYDVLKGSDTQYCILQIVREPWKKVLYIAVFMMLSGAVLLFMNGPKKMKDGNVE